MNVTFDAFPTDHVRVRPRRRMRAFACTGLALLATLYPLACARAATNNLGPGNLMPGSTNAATAPRVPATVVTNTPAATNIVPKVTPRPTTGITVQGVFLDSGEGKFSVSGRVLKLPAPEPASADETNSPWRRSIAFGMNMTSGNSDTLRYSLGLDVVRERDEDLARLRAQGMYGESSSQKDVENASARLRYERQLSRRTYGLTYADWLTDTIAGTDYRVTAIASPGWHLLRTQRTILNVEAGAGYLEQKKSDDTEGFAAGRLAASLENLLNAHVLAWCAAEYIPEFADPDVFFVNAEAGIASMLARNLSLHVTLQDRYDNAPAPDRKGNDVYLTAALNLSF